jgi:NADPH-dependent ferric siderophore reductase
MADDVPSKFRTRVVRTEQLAPHMVRVVVGGEELRRFPDTGFTDRYVKLIFPRPGVEIAEDAELWSLPPEQRPVFRTYTVRDLDLELLELTIDFVLHGDEGIAGPWAAAAQPGDELLLSGPGGAYFPRADVDQHLLVGDDAALPAIAAALEALPPGAAAVVLVEVDDAHGELALAGGAGVELRWLHRSATADPDALLAAVRGLELVEGRVQAFVHGELHAVRAIKRHLVDDRGLEAELLSASGYWRRGKTEDGFQAEKRELAQLDRAG